MYGFMRQVTRETENNTNELLSPPCPCGTENISSSQCMWDAGILNGSHGRKLLRFVTFQPLQRRIGNGQGAERHSLIKGRGVSFMEANNDWHHNRITSKTLEEILAEFDG